MISILVNFLQICLIIGALAFIINLMIRRDLKDKTNESNEETGSEDTEPTTEVVYFESMSPEKKLKKIIEEFNKIEKLITPGQELNDFHKCLTEVRQLKCKVFKVYDNGCIQFNNAIWWLEKPLVSRGKYKAVPYNEDGTISLDINNVEEAVRLITATESSNNILKDAGSVDDYSTDDNESSLKSEKSVSENASKFKFGIPEIKLQQLLEARHTINSFRPLVEFWFFEFFYYVLQSIKIWYVVLIIVHRSMFNLNNLENVIDSVSNWLKELIIIHTNVNKKDDVTTVTLNIFPKKTEKTNSRLERVWAFFKKFWA